MTEQWAQDSGQQDQAEQGMCSQWDNERAATAQRGEQHRPLCQDEDRHMKIGDMIESKYLKQSDVPDPMIVTIHGLKKVNVARDDEDPDYRWTCKFAEMPKPMVLNVTNLKRLAKALGDDTEDWMGEAVELYTDPDIEFGGNVVGGLRLRGIKKAAAKPARKTEDEVNSELADDDVPF
jgi:hypothetical protein